MMDACFSRLRLSHGNVIARNVMTDSKTAANRHRNRADFERERTSLVHFGHPSDFLINSVRHRIDHCGLYAFDGSHPHHGTSGPRLSLSIRSWKEVNTTPAVNELKDMDKSALRAWNEKVHIDATDRPTNVGLFWGTSDTDEIAVLYKAHVAMFHPDKNQSDELAAERTQLLNNARDA